MRSPPSPTLCGSIFVFSPMVQKGSSLTKGPLVGDPSRGSRRG